MNKSNFDIKVNGIKVIHHEAKYDSWLFKHVNKVIPKTKYLRLYPYGVDGYTPLSEFTKVKFFFNKKNPYTEENLLFIKKEIKPYVSLWRKEAKEWRSKSKSIVRAKKLISRIRNVIHKQGLDQDFQGDCVDVSILEVIRKKADLKKYHATGDFLTLISRQRTRTYAKSSQWKSSTRTDRFIIGINENGNSFIHQVSKNVKSLKEAYDWIWRGNKIIYRQGDIGLAESNLKKVIGEETDIDVLGHSRHRFIGAVKVNNSVHVKGGFLYHTGEQHPTIYLDDSKWYRVIPAKRSQVRMSSAD